jgi:hypothetical protein
LSTMTATEANAIREAADYLRGHAYSARDQWTKAEARRLAEQLEHVLTVSTADPSGALHLNLGGP